VLLRLLLHGHAQHVQQLQLLLRPNGGDIEWRLILRVELAGVGADVQKEFRGVRITLARGQVERRVAVGRFGIDVGSVLDEKLHHVHVAHRHRPVQRG